MGRQMSECFWWKRKECPRQRISQYGLRAKHVGSVDIVSGMMLFCMLVLIIFFAFRMTQYMVTAAKVEDALAASNLASALVDVEEYGKSHRIRIADGERAFQIYRDALQSNMNLDQELYSTNHEFVLGQVQIKEYIVYNVLDEEVDIQVYDGNGVLISVTIGNKGEIFTPDRICVENTTIYSRIGFQVAGLAGHTISGEKEKSIDIARWNSD